MATSFNNSSLDDLKSQINIVDVIGRVVNLKRAGANYKGVCPFHNEKTPSFVVSEQKQIFTCFGCGATGDAIEFTKRYFNLEFTEAIEKLGKEYGIEVKLGTVNPEREQYYQINKEAALFFYKAFTEDKNAGYTYMKNRGMDDITLKKFGIGYADEQWDSLYNYFKAKGVKEKALLELGLISEKNGKYYDKFRDRVMFPIINTSGKVIGFGGRAIGDANPKYLNSPENRIFQKKNNLYGLNTTKQDIGKEGIAILVEGYMDAISLYQGGVRNVAASLGTALTEYQSKLIKRYTRNVVLSYDADSAGRAAALRGIDILSKEDIKVKVLHVTDGKDPDEFIKKKGRDAFLKLVAEAPSMVEYKLANARAGLDLNKDEDKIEFLKKAAAILRTVKPVEADIYVKKISQEYHISEGAIRMEVLGNNNHDQSYNAVPGKHSRGEAETPEMSELEKHILKVLIVNPAFVERMLGYEDIFTSLIGKKTIGIIFQLYGNKEDFTLSEITDSLEPIEAESLAASLDSVPIAGNEEQEFKECIRTWEIKKLKKQANELWDRLSLTDEKTDAEVSNELLEKYQSVQKQIEFYEGEQ